MVKKHLYSTPIVSIVIPCFNSEKYLAQTLESVKRQSFQNWECLVIDDGSRDQTAEIAQRYVDFDPRFKFFSQKNSGVSAAYNQGIIKSQKKYIAFIDSDDIWLSKMLETSIDFLKRNSKIDIVSCGWQNIDKNDRIESKIYTPWHTFPFKEEMMLRGALFMSSTTVIKREVFNKAGLFDENLRSAEDWDLWLRFIKNDFSFGFIKQPFLLYRRHRDNLTLDVVTMEKSIDKVISKHFKKNKFKLYIYIFQWLYLAELCYEAKDFLNLKKLLLKAEKYYDQAPRVKKYEKEWLKMLYGLPYTNKFIQKISKIQNSFWGLIVLSNRSYRKARNSFQQKKYILSIIYFFIFILYWPPVIFKRLKFKKK